MKKEYRYYVYIATNKRNNVLYTGITNSLVRRDFEHKNKLNKNGFTAKYNINKIVFYEYSEDVYLAIQREKEIKGWKRDRKMQLIKEFNSKWEDLLQDIY